MNPVHPYLAPGYITIRKIYLINCIKIANRVTGISGKISPKSTEVLTYGIWGLDLSFYPISTIFSREMPHLESTFRSAYFARSFGIDVDVSEEQVREERKTFLCNSRSGCFTKLFGQIICSELIKCGNKTNLSSNFLFFCCD